MPPIEFQRYAVIGSGAVGGLYGGLLAQAGAEVHFLLRSDYEHVAANGLQIETPTGNFHLDNVHAHGSVDSLPACDVTMVALKSTSNDRLHELLAPTTRDGGIALVLQNGLDVELDTANVVGLDRVLGGCCFLCSNKLGPGHIKHLDYGRIVFGEYVQNHTDVTERVQKIADEMNAAGIDAHGTADLAAARWRKLMWNIPFNGLSVALNASTKVLVEDPDSLHIVESIIEEVYEAATAAEVVIDPSMKEVTVEMTRKMVPYDSSMRLDYINGRPMEIESIIGNPLRAARKLGVDMPFTEMLYHQLKFIEQTRA
ncbi:MAG: putative 2-dehydropantoate 2-reductase [Planctomycetota bacterium]